MNLPKLLTLKSEFRAVHGFPATHVFVGPRAAENFPPDARPYGLIVVEVDDLSLEIAVGVLYPPIHAVKP